MKLTLGPTARISLGLLSLAVTLLLALDLLLGVFPDPARQAAQARRQFAENIAIQVASLLMHDERERISQILPELLRRDPALQSIGVRTADSRLLVATPQHELLWVQGDAQETGRSRFAVSIGSASRGEDAHWGQVEVAFTPLDKGLFAFFTPAIKLILLFSLAGSVIYYFYLRRTLIHLDPSAAVPERVQMAFDAMSEAVVVLDAKQRIVMANSSFEKLLPDDTTLVTGRCLESFPWLRMGLEHIDAIPPWEDCFRSKTRSETAIFEATDGDGKVHRLVVNASPVLDAKNAVRGCMVSFNDVTELDEANRQLVALMADLSESKEQLEVQNRELYRLANVDPMTGARNRRSFFPEFERLFAEARERDLPLAFIMADIDKFKSVNDNYGHAIGDKVIQKFASILLASARDTDIVCRYGGEEFCVALPGADAEQAWQVAERIRERVKAEVGSSLPLDPQPVITSSFGVASIISGAESAEQLADFADQALYHSKHNGRNRCTTYTVGMAQDKKG
ncbi:sensor domain-containing diguanylate cyclase [Uliginosibacterium aquaticum]|uniref:diguanylate cyclase n=1 Tax=Uliginosibacterium aquaticum TaxID=2731212 RepID=A0ABX2ID84_9RHOO|nr:diguanylate cyclase [Uliginosibacterium aquaticum]NSL54494.1 diguanylate cyclase [Uliginosibacterium aquaticum]